MPMSLEELEKRDPSEVVSVEEACAILGESRSTIYRCRNLGRVRLAPGRVGYAIHTLIDELRRRELLTAKSEASQFPTNLWLDDWDTDQPGALPAFFESMPPRVSTLVRRRHRGWAKGEKVRTYTLWLPAAEDWRRWGHSELIVIDFDSLNKIAPTIIIPQGDEHIGGKKELKVTKPGALVRLMPLSGWVDRMPDGWWVS